MRIFYYSTDDEILECGGYYKNFSYNELILAIESELKLLLLSLSHEDFVCISQSALFESEVCRYITIRYAKIFEAGLFRVISNEDTLADAKERKKERYAHVARIDKYRKAYFSDSKKGRITTEIVLEKKDIDTGSSSFSAWVKMVKERSRKISLPPTMLKDFIKRLTDTEKNAFLWESVKKQAASCNLTRADVLGLKIREKMNQSYIDSYDKAGFVIPCAGFCTDYTRSYHGVVLDMKKCVYCLGVREY